MSHFDTLLGQFLAGNGGGGSSDFSTAKVTLVCSGGAGYMASVSAIIVENDKLNGDSAYLENGDICTIVLYKGSAEISVNDDDDHPITGVSGDATLVSGETNYVDVTGDCTITIAGSSPF